MQAKKFQDLVLDDLDAFLNRLDPERTIAEAFGKHWKDKSVVPVGRFAYKDTMPNAPHVCMKVPTGGGKTFLATCSLRKILARTHPDDGAPTPRMVVWLVPSLTILRQTLRNLRNPRHPYGQALHADFNGRYAVLDKEEALGGVGLSPVLLRERTTILVLSMDSLKTSNMDDRKLLEANGRLMSFIGQEGIDLGGKEAPSVLDVVRGQRPLVIVDESHNATTTLSRRMLAGLLPSFVLDLSATPKSDANVISYANALAMKSEGMVKLPVVLRNLPTAEEVIASAILLRQRLEEKAEAERKKSGRYIRPIVLFQAESRGSEARKTFESIKADLIGKERIPAEQIAIKTAEIDEIGDRDLLSPECPIRFVITVNALKEGWDCPFAYVLASMANRSSEIDVEQILGRILRQPHATPCADRDLNMSFVFTSSARFKETTDAIIAGLNGAGFSGNAVRGRDLSEDALESAGLPLFRASGDGSILLGADEDARDIDAMAEAQAADGREDSMIEDARNQNEQRMRVEFAGVASAIRIPQFGLAIKETGRLDLGILHPLEKENLLDRFNLLSCDSAVELSSLADDGHEIDIRAADGREAGSRPVIRAVSVQQYDADADRLMAKADPAKEIARAIRPLVGSLPPVSDKELLEFIRRVLAAQTDPAVLRKCAVLRTQFARRIREEIIKRFKAAAKNRFDERLRRDEIKMIQESYSLPPVIHPMELAPDFDLSLYDREPWLNGLERAFVNSLTALDNVLFWHKNQVRGQSFRLNGPFNQYPDFIVVMRSGKVVLVETKGDDRDGSDSKSKLEIGDRWAAMAGPRFSYFMVFKGNDNLPGALSLDALIAALRVL